MFPAPTTPRSPSILLAAAAAAVVYLLLPAAAGAQERAEEERRRPSVEASRLRDGDIEVDGRLAESAWGRAVAATDFVQGRPTEGAEPAQPTEVRILYDGENLYVGARMHEADASAIASQLVRRDERGQYDYFELALDPNRDGQTGYEFRIGVSGVERDAFVSGGGGRRGGQGANWNAVWESATRIDSAGWTAELRIPLSQIRFESGSGRQAWGINFTRRRLASSSTSFWSLESRTVQGAVNQWGRLTGLRFGEAPGRFEVEPYAVTQLASRPVSSGNPLTADTKLSPRFGVDLSRGVGSGFTLDATVNPDFGQVEVDPAVINLTAFETFFPEKRSFFVQDAQIFDFDLLGRNSTLFFSRRIGREPRGGAPEAAAHAEVPERTTILGASKFTGRTESGLSVGALAAVTAEEHGRAFYPASGETRDFVVEPATEYGVGRIKQDFRGGATTVGGILTGVNRHLPSGDRLEELPAQAFSGGLDVEHQWGGTNDRRWSLEGYYAATRVQGSPTALRAVQTNPQHYFQRPDAGRLEVDSAATSLMGANWRLAFSRQNARHWTWGVWVHEITPGFAANDLGFNTDGSRLNAGGRIEYQEIEPGPLFRNWSVSAFTYQNFRHTLLEDVFSADRWARSYNNGAVNLDARLQLHNNWWFSPEVSYRPQSLSDTKTRGGPLMTRPSRREVELRFGTDPRKRVSMEPSVSYGTRGLGAGASLETGVEVAVRPAPNWEIRLQPRLRKESTAAQYVTTLEGAGHAPTFGDRYLFADLERTQVSMETRLNVAFSPELSLQLFAQPLVSAVDFTSIKQLERPASFRFRRFGEGEAKRLADGGVRCEGGRSCLLEGTRYLDYDGDGTSEASFRERDFNFRSLRGNAVLRWEYLPGSTLFLVWQHDRRSEEGVGRLDLSRDLDALLGTGAENRLIVKASHFLDL